MVSKRWQKSQTFVAHGALASIFGLPFGVLELNLGSFQKIGLVIIGWAILIPLFREIHKRYASTFVKVFKCDYEMAARIVQRR